MNDRTSAKIGLVLTILLGMSFTFFQAMEYSEAGFSYDGSLYGSAFFMATGFHGAHVIIGTLFLIVCLLRLMTGGMKPSKHLGLRICRLVLALRRRCLAVPVRLCVRCADAGLAGRRRARVSGRARSSGTGSNKCGQSDAGMKRHRHGRRLTVIGRSQVSLPELR